jgi:hypothetical protein
MPANKRFNADGFSSSMSKSCGKSRRQLCVDRYIAKILGQKRVVFFRYELCIERPVNGEFEGLSIDTVYDQNLIIYLDSLHIY